MNRQEELAYYLLSLADWFDHMEGYLPDRAFEPIHLKSLPTPATIPVFEKGVMSDEVQGDIREAAEELLRLADLEM